jgi:YHS domain-containing protein
MLCHLGIVAGFVVGSMLGGPWMFIAPAIGFGLGIIMDMTLMGRLHKGHEGYGGGCCGGGHMHSEKAENTVKDPVCGMQVNEKTANYKAEIRGKTYYFCSPECKSSFDKNPERYV